MLTFEGKSASFVVGKESPNKEPPVSKFVVEKLYRVHRRRILNMEPVVDCHVEIPNFLTDTSWKAAAHELKLARIAKENETIYKRIAKRENEESQLNKETRDHNHRVNEIKQHDKRIKEAVRIRKAAKIQKENEMMHQRIERARPEYTLKSIKEWYKYHIHIKEGRRSDPTAGHIMRGMRGLLPPALPPVSVGDGGSQDVSLDAMSVNSAQSWATSIASMNIDDNVSGIYSYSSASIRSSTSGKSSITSPSRGPWQPDLMNLPLTGVKDTSLFKLEDNAQRAKSKKKRKKKQQQKVLQPLESAVGGMMDPSHSHNNSHHPHNNHTHHESKETDRLTVSFDAAGGNDESKKPHSFTESKAGEGLERSWSTAIMEEVSKDEEEDDMEVLTSKHVEIPFDSSYCIVNISVPKIELDGNLYIQVFASENPKKMLCERVVPVDKAEEIKKNNRKNISQAVDDDDMMALRKCLVDLFMEVDADKNGYLTFDEFEKLMEKVNLGITSSELRFVIQEADSNNNGLVEFAEFVPLAVDLILSFRARNRARVLANEANAALDERVNKNLDPDHLEAMTNIFMSKIQEHDSHNIGCIREVELRRILASVSGLGLSDVELNYICEELPHDKSGKLIYKGLNEVLMKAHSYKLRFDELMGDSDKYLSDMVEKCFGEENSLRQDDPHSAKSGKLPLKVMTQILMEDTSHRLSQLQVLVILSGITSTVSSNGTAFVNYLYSLPLMIKCIELMLDPKTLRLRQELIFAKDLSSEQLTKALTDEGPDSQEFLNMIRMVFDSFDHQDSGTINEDQFVQILGSLDFHQTDVEMRALFSVADRSFRGYLTFDELCSFMASHLQEFEKEKHVRILDETLHNPMRQHGDGANPTSLLMSKNAHLNIVTDKTEEQEAADFDFESHLTQIFAIEDKNGSGYLTAEAFERLLKNLHIHLTPFQIQIVLSEINFTEDGLGQYRDFVPTCAKLLKVFAVKELADEEKLLNEQKACDKADEIMAKMKSDIAYIYSYIEKKTIHIQSTVSDPFRRFKMLQDDILSPHSHLTKPEGNTLLRLLYMIGEKKEGGGSSSHSMRSPSPDTMSRSSIIKFFQFRPIPTNVITTQPTSKPQGKAGKGPTPGTPPSSSTGYSTEPPLSKTELWDAIVRVKQQTIMKRILDNKHMDAVQVNLTKILQAESKKVIEKTTKLRESSKQQRVSSPSRHSKSAVEVDPAYIPVNVAFSVLEEHHEFRLERSHILGILSWCDAYSSAHSQYLNINKFAEFASRVIHDISEGDFHETRRQALESSSSSSSSSTHSSQGKPGVIASAMTEDDNELSPLSLLNGLTEEEMEEYYMSLFTYAQTSDGDVTKEQVFEIVLNTPKLKLNEKETAAIVAGFPHTDNGMLRWQEFVKHAHDTLVSACRERRVGKMFFKSGKLAREDSQMSSDSGDKPQLKRKGSTPDFMAKMENLKRLSNRFVEFVKLKYVGDVLIIGLPGDVTTRRSTLMQVAESYDPTTHNEDEIVELARLSCMLPTVIVKPPSTKPSGSNSPKSIGNKSFIAPASPKVSIVKKPFSASTTSTSPPSPSSSSPPVTMPPLSRQGSSSMSSSTERDSPLLKKKSEKVRMPYLVRIVAVEKNFYSAATAADHGGVAPPSPIYCNLISIDGQYSLSQLLPMALPSHAAVDRDSARIFARNIIDSITVYLDGSARKITINVDMSS